MLILGLSDSHDASVTLIEDDKVLAAVSEERFTRRKRQQGFPYKSLEYIKTFIEGRNLDRIYISGKYGRAVFRALNFFYSKADPCKKVFSFSSKAAYWLENIMASVPFLKEVESKVGLQAVKKRLKKAGIKFSSLESLDHHFSHIISALSGMDSKDYLAVSLDAYGDGKSGLVVRVWDSKIINIKEVSYRNSIAQFYGYICAYLGFKEGDEGKAMALADFGKPGAALKILRSIFKIDKKGIKVNPKYKKRSFAEKLKEYSDKEVAFALQKVTEEVVLEFIASNINTNKKIDLFLSGGFFANIKVTQRLYETGLFNRVFVFPNMGDGGISFIAGINKVTSGNMNKCIADIAKTKFIELENVYLGPEYLDDYIEDFINSRRLNYSIENNIEAKIAQLLAKGELIARFNGRMEYGPRALGNRSILYQTADKEVNGWLNNRLKRTEFMPFAPVTLFEFKDKCYKNILGLENAARFMTVSVNCTDWMKKISPAVVHVDGTARPQLIREEDNAGYYRILKEYHKITGIPSLINTSFNMHGEPIVCSPEEAVQTFIAAKIDYLAIGKFLVRNPMPA